MSPTIWLKVKRIFRLGAVVPLTVVAAILAILPAKGANTNSATEPVAPSPSNGIAPGGNSTATSTPPAASGDASLTAAAILEKAKATYAALASYSDTGTITTQMGDFSQTTTFKIRLQRPSLYRIDWQSSPQAMSSGATWSDGTGDFLTFAGRTAEKQANRQMALGAATGISSGAAATIPGTFFGDMWGNALGLAGQHERQPDEPVEGVDCYVVSEVIKGAGGKTIATTLWIGKADNFIRQKKTVTEGPSTIPSISDAVLEKVLQSQNKPVTPEAMAALKAQFTSAEAMVKGKTVEFTETHENIVTNKTFAPADFKPESK